MSAEILHLITDENGEIINATDAALRELGAKAGVRCRRVVEAATGDGARICTTTCAHALKDVGQRDHGAVQVKGQSYRLVCSAAGEMRVITLVPLSTDTRLDEALTPREREVLALVARGRTNPQIARALDLSASTVRTHMEHILAKLGVRTRAAAAAKAIASGVIPA
ncbi:LuxR C-terminal-related transcriptional regulator [Myxococcota bacterium]|nr:LuxR C-terminal-related transcriptional regulator [Myxococcota bacterium]